MEKYYDIKTRSFSVKQIITAFMLVKSVIEKDKEYDLFLEIYIKRNKLSPEDISDVYQVSHYYRWKKKINIYLAEINKHKKDVIEKLSQLLSKI